MILEHRFIQGDNSPFQYIFFPGSQIFIFHLPPLWEICFSSFQNQRAILDIILPLPCASLPFPTLSFQQLPAGRYH